MSDSVKPIPEEYHSLTPHLVISGASDAIDFYKKAFGAEELARMPAPDGKRLLHAALKIGNSVMMLCDEFPEMGGDCRSPKTLGNTCVTLHLFVEDADAAFNRAVEAGATVTMPPVDMFWGDRYGKVSDPFGHEWSIATRIKDMTPEEMQQAAQEAFGCGAG